MTRPAAQKVLSAGALEVSPAAYTARVAGRVLPLTPRELELLVELMRRQDEIVPREELYRLCWGGEMEPSVRAVDVYVRKLRAKLDAVLPGWQFIHTHYRLGYRFAPVQPPESRPATSGASERTSRPAVNERTRSIL